MKFRLKASKNNVLFALLGLFKSTKILNKNVVNYVNFDVTKMKATPDATSIYGTSRGSGLAKKQVNKGRFFRVFWFL